MKKFAYAVAFSLCSTSAFAADLILAPEEVYVPSAVTAFDWSGFYAGVHLGYGRGTIFADDGPGIEADASGWLGGIQAGANMQYGALVFGVEGDIAVANIGGEDEAYLEDYELNALGSLRARAGFAVDNFLFYGTAGLGAGQLTLLDVDYGEESNWLWGWAAGAGVEFALDDNWSVKGEYMYYSLREELFEFPTGDDYNASANVHTVKVGLDYSF